MKLRRILWLPVTAVIVLTGFAVFAQTQTIAPVTSAVSIDVKAAMAPRSLGNPKAPVKIDEYASLSCTHCAEFSKESFDKFKHDYIDTGKVYYTFNDFPLNAPALEAAMVARCLPANQYFPFVKFLFDTQDKWAFDEHYSDSLKQNSKLVGLDDATFNACINNQDLKQALIGKMQVAAKAKKNPVQATPTFLINGGQVIIGGALPYDQFQKKLNPIVAVSGGVDTK